MKTTRRRFLAGTIGAVGLFLAGPAIRPAALRIKKFDRPSMADLLADMESGWKQNFPIDRRYDETDADLRSRILSTIREHDGGVSI